MDGNQLGTKGMTFSEVMRPKLQQKKVMDQIETFAKVMGPKLQQKKIWDQIETFAKVMRPKVHFSQKIIRMSNGMIYNY